MPLAALVTQGQNFEIKSIVDGGFLLHFEYKMVEIMEGLRILLKGNRELEIRGLQQKR